MPPLAQVQTGHVDLIAMILKSRSLNARLDRNQIDAYIAKVQHAPLEKQQEIYGILMEEQEKFVDISNRMKASVQDYTAQLEHKKAEVIKQMYKEAEQEEKSSSDESISTLLHQLDK
jgi:hypothetical protein